ncbi:MAG: SMC family ATPase [Thermoplasmata archaeon]|nr:SMC family ATPase [Thermoplasmata archaeon]
MTIQIAHVGLRNLRSYRSAELDLGAGTTLLSGDIGSGKTSLLYAVEMALFGFAEVDAGYLVRHGARDAEVSLTLTDGDHRWELRRRFVRKARKGRDTFEPTENSLAVDGQRTAYSATELRRRTIDLLGFPDNPNPRAHSDVWRWAVYLAQERMRDVLDPDAESRMETVRKALGVEQYRLAGDNARGLARALQERAAGLAEQASRHRGIEDEAVRWRAAETLAQHRLSELDDRERNLRLDLGESRGRLEDFERRRREMERAREAVAQQERLAEELERAVGQERRALQSAQEILARLETERARESRREHRGGEPPASIAELRTRREEVTRRLGDLEGLRGQVSVVAEQIAERAARAAELGVRTEATRVELAHLRSGLARLEATEPVDEPKASDDRNLAQLQAERTQREEKRRDLDRRLATATAELRELAELVQKGVCPRCRRPVEASEFESHRHDEEGLVARLERELAAATERVRRAGEEAQARLEFERRHDQWVLLDSRRSDLRQRQATCQARHTEEGGLQRQLDAERLALEGRQRALVARLEGYDRVRAELALVDGAIFEREARARAAAAQVERLAAVERRIPEVQAEIDLRHRNGSERAARRAEVLQQIESSRSRLRPPDELEAAWQAARRRTEDLDGTLQGLLREASGPRGTLAEMKARLDEVARRLRERDALAGESAQLSGLAAWVDGEFRNAMIELEQRRLLQGRRQFERRFAQYFAALVEDPSLSARVDETFAPWADLAGQPTPAEGLSGGERTALALAYRLALGRMVRDAGRLTLETLILDEPTEGFSQEQTLRMGDLLESLGLPQVILVSHERQLEGIADRVVRIRKKEGVSSIEEWDRTFGAAARPARPMDEAPGAPVVPKRRRKTRRLTDIVPAASGGDSAQAR